MTTNVSFEYSKAENEYLQAGTDEEKLAALEKMWSTRPTHKGGEALRANLRTRIKKLREKIITGRKKQKKIRSKEGIKKEGTQVVLIGLANSGKSSLIALLTNAKPEISPYEFTTKHPILGSLDYDDVKFQIVDMPAINYEAFDQGIANTADILLLIISSIQDLEQINQFLGKSFGKKIIAFNKSDLLNQSEIRKTEATLKSKKYNFVMISSRTGQGILELKNKLVENSGVVRIYTKQPGRPKDKQPVIFRHNPTVKEVSEKILKGLASRIKETRIWGPSSKFASQKVGLTHELKDKDIVEFKTI